MAEKVPLDPLTQATVTVAWVVLLNKPFYPLYVWWLVGSGIQASLWTLVSVPFFLLIIYLGPRNPLAARIALPLVGAVDTLFETMLFGYDSGTELFLAPCIMLVALSFYSEEKWWQRGMAALLFVVFFAAHDRLGAALHEWSPSESALLNINVFAVASLMAFIAIRYAGIPRR
ncbi:hypothetical protein IHQ71_01035 [Rhizobium sp. TH2]|uniref:hypothetical protein n=1 Tax=Rhizobium sp. TH2 TaxID=2775403 RepID=UPI00215701BD|nr:hypothetical protein [Rhizobium sp. TH2]UVC09246.1 hypothetical protein IHQ71_01035 [Rhizobium sp. TH2]